MESRHRQDQLNSNHQLPHHFQSNAQAHSSHQGAHEIDSAGFQYHNPNTVQQQQQQTEDQFSTYFNDDSNSTSFNPSWDPSAIIDPRLQENGFGHSSNSWLQNSLQTTNSLQQSEQGLPSNDYVNGATRNNSVYGFSGFGGSQYPSFAANSYDQNLAFGTNSLLSNNFVDSINPTYGNSNLQGETISPSALQSYPNGYGPLPDGAQDDESTSNFNHVSLEDVENQTQRSERLYDDAMAKFISAKIPEGQKQGNMLVKDPVKLREATNSEQYHAFVFMGSESLESDDPRVVPPRITPRYSLKDIKRRAIETQGDRPWDLTQRPLVKRLKLRASAPKAHRPPSTVNQPVQPSSSSSSSAESSSGEESHDDFGSDEEVEPMEPSPLPPTRPTDPEGAVEYDVIKIVWFASRIRVPGPSIRNALGSYWNLIKPIRDKWKAEITAMQDVESKKTKSDIDYRSRATAQRKLIERAIHATVQYGHPDILEKLSENHNLFLMFYQLIADRFTDRDYNAIVVKSILKLMLECAPLGKALLEKTKLDKVLPKLAKKGNEETRELCQKAIEHSAKPSEEKPTGNGTPTNEATRPIQPVPATSRLPESLSVRKPAKETGDAATKKIEKAGTTKVGSPATGSKPSTIPGRSSSVDQTKSSAVKTGAKPPGSAAATDAPPTKVKHVISKPSPFMGLQSASKKPGTSMTAQKAATAPASNSKSTKPVESGVNKPASLPPKPPPPASKPAFSFAETIANLNKPKEVTPNKRAPDDRPEETEEQRNKRLRKKSRAHLRVKWKPDSILVETRYFRHDPEEELEHDPNVIHDDFKNEGKMLKLHKDREEFDEEENIAEETEFMPWRTPTAVDFSALASNPDCEKNYVSRGGARQPTSPESVAQAHRELNTLIAIYPTTADIPSTPREPNDMSTGDDSKCLAFGEPPQKIRDREARFYASQRPQAQQQRYTPPAQPTQSGPSTANDISNLLSILNSSQQANMPQSAPPQPAPQPSAVNPSLEAIFAQFSQANSQAPAAQPLQAQPQIDPSIQNALNIFNQQQQQSQASMYNPPAYAPPPAMQHQQQQPAVPDLNALLTQFSQQNRGQGAGGFGYQNMNPNAGANQNAYLQGANASSNPNPYPQSNERKRGYEGNGPGSHDRYGGGGGGSGNNKRAKNWEDRAKTMEEKKKTVPCSYYRRGQCKRGDQCTFIHE